MDVPSDLRARHQWYLDQSLRIAVWELIFGSGDLRIVERLVAAGATWRPERESALSSRSEAPVSVSAGRP